MVSIVVPVFNSEEYLLNCIESILSQSYQDIEVVLVDDGSTDSSRSICDRTAVKDNRIKVIHKKNGGVSSARNTGLRIIQGEWVMFVDADDELYNDSIEILMKSVASNVDMVIGGYRHYSEEGKVIYEINDRIKQDIDKLAALKMMYKSLYYNYQGNLWNKLYKREVLVNNHLSFSESIYYNEDRLFIVEYLTMCSNRIVYDTTPVYKYYVRKTGAMASLNSSFNRKFITDFDAYVLMYKRIRSRIKDRELLKQARRGVFLSYSRIKDMMKQFGIIDTKLQLHLLNGIRTTGSYGFVFRHLLSNFMLYLTQVRNYNASTTN